MTMNSTPTESPDAFRVSQLLSDTRYRAKTLQTIAGVLIMLFLGWLAANTLSNLNTLGKPLSFSFLGDKAGYDINQRLIPYTAEDTHLRAALTGLMNTLVVAVLGCLTATILGLFIGIARLSPNAGLARLARVYVEIFRNVPLLLWLLLIFALLTETLPAPDAFRGEDPSATLIFSDSVAVTNRGVFVPSISFNQPRFGWLLLGLIAGLSVLAGLLRSAAKRHQSKTGRPVALGLPILATWALSLMALVYWAGPTVSYPELRGFNFRDGIHLRTSLVALWLALALYTAAFIAEIVRAGITAVNKGQKEAAAALGLRGGQTMRLVVLPQALRVIIPPLISNYLNLTKNSSLAIAVGYMDLTGTLMGITLNQTGRELETVLLGMSFYLAVSISISLVLNWYNARVQLRER
ncbi:putative glutamine ABC transporter permease protein GlnM [Pseudooctadecabacter jejudonensis]|uniref:Putative glutamine ABC transporter permease protein GlnM n=2 Tax=Pseudooctadecabacter jejudonensis TaxID=1391910 RepID=A0A1Y5SS31_9RHOB|nr:putative glutamine ABC transporter permease protein GlnM [Pseudooctadecabacter jejudonensis]